MATDYAGIAQSFRVARELISDKRESYICVALFGIDPHGARRIISDRIKGYESLKDWVRVHVLGGIIPADDDMRAYRLRWLDALIAEFEGYAKEDSTND